MFVAPRAKAQISGTLVTYLLLGQISIDSFGYICHQVPKRFNGSDLATVHTLDILYFLPRCANYIICSTLVYLGRGKSPGARHQLSYREYRRY